MGTDSVSGSAGYCHLSMEEREYICVRMHEGKSCSEIARVLNRHRSTIARELRRNWSVNARLRYSPSQAHRSYLKRLSKAHRRYRLQSPQIRSYVYRQLRQGWSPEIIAGRLPLDHPGHSTNYESIYQFIYLQRPSWGSELPRARRKRRNRRSSRRGRWTIPHRVGIDSRPQAANDRSEVGHWEADTIVSRQSSAALQVLYERKTRYVIISKLPQKTAQAMKCMINYNLSRFRPTFLRSITYDNGSENYRHEQVNRVLGTQSYFCNPYHSWEKGGVEQTNGLIRRYFPKSTDFSCLNRYKIKLVERRLNTRPRKCLGFRTPDELIRQCGALKH